MLTFAIAFVVLLLLGGVVFLVVYQNRQRKRFLGRLSDVLGTVQSGRTARGTYEGTEYEYEYFEGAQSSPSYFKVRVGGFRHQSFRITKEGAFDRVSKQLGFSHEIQTGDPEFDRDFYIAAESDDLPPGFFGDEIRRRAVRNIIALGFTSVENVNSKLQAGWSPFAIRQEFDPSIVTRAVANLVELSGDEPLLTQDRSGSEKRWGSALLWLFPGIAIAAYLVGPALYPPLDQGDFFLWSLKYSTTTLLLSVVFTVVRLQGKSTAHRELLGILVISIIAFPLGGWGVATLLNGCLDRAGPAPHVTLVMAKREHRGRHTSYHAIVESWRPRRRREDIRVSLKAYEAIVPNLSRLNVTTKPGRFGFEWVAGYGLGKPDNRTAGQSLPQR